MYNPVNMKIEDRDRLYEKDLREKNKRQRFEVRYDVESKLRKEGIEDQMKQEAFGVNKISYMRFREAKERGFDILTNDGHTQETLKKIEGPSAQPPMKVWNAARQTANAAFLSETDKKFIQDEINEDAFAVTKATLAYH